MILAKWWILGYESLAEYSKRWAANCMWFERWSCFCKWHAKRWSPEERSADGKPHWAGVYSTFALLLPCLHGARII